MKCIDWQTLIPSVVACLAALTAYLKARTAKKSIDSHTQEKK